jgi:uncharacterized protein (DUF58 family)
LVQVTLQKSDPLGARSAAAALSARLPLIVLEARRISSILAAGLHGRGRAGSGEAFWQYRNFINGESASRIDWRRSARHDSTYFVREREWESPHAFCLWIDRSASMHFCSDHAQVSKGDRALIIGLALADLLVRSGESVALMGLTAPTASHRVIDLFAEAMIVQPATQHDRIPDYALTPRSEAILIGDWLTPIETIAQPLAQLSGLGAKGHLLHILDPVEVTFPFTGETELIAVEGTGLLDIGDAEAFRASYLERMREHTDHLKEITSKIGWHLDQHITDAPASDAVRKLLLRMIAP